MATSERSGSERLFRIHRPEVTPLRVLAAVILSVGISLTGGPLGIGIGIVVAGTSLLTTAPVTIALGHVLLLGVLAEPTLIQLLVVESGFALVLGAAAARLTTAKEVMSAALLGFGVLLSIVSYLVDAVDDLWVVCGIFIALVTAVAYGLYRYELVQRGLVTSGGQDDR